MERNALIHYGTAIKATDNADGSVTLSGLAVVFDEPGTKNRDLTGEYFTADTYYGAASKSGSITVDAPFHHHIPLDGSAKAAELADAILGEATMTKTDAGWLASLVLPMRTAYEKEIAQLAKDGKLGWSTGTAPHMYRAAKSGQITRWPIIEVSPTPIPAEPRTYAGVKSLSSMVADYATGDGADAPTDAPEPTDLPEPTEHEATPSDLLKSLFDTLAEHRTATALRSLSDLFASNTRISA